VSLIRLARRGIERAKTAGAMGLKRTHAEFLGQGEGLMVLEQALRLGGNRSMRAASTACTVAGT
jgi:hypothetical protein